MQALVCSRRVPGPTSFWEVVVIAPDRAFLRKVFSPAFSVSLQPRNNQTPGRGPGATPATVSLRITKITSLCWVKPLGASTCPVAG